MTDKKQLKCSFCTKQQHEVKKLIAGPEVYICDECVKLCSDILSEDKTEVVEGIPSPSKIMEFLDKYVIGQYQAKMVMSVAVHNHYKRLANPIIDDVELDKSNVIMTGPSGSGKTLLAQSIARFLDVPFAIADATSLTESGYVGDDVESIITRLLQVADNDVTKAERGIIYLDELDKKAKKGDNVSITRDVSGEGVQQALLKIIEGTEVRVSIQSNRKHPNAEMLTVNTKNILFIVGGAFVGLEKVVAERLDKDKSGVGFGSKLAHDKTSVPIGTLLAQVEPEDLTRYGLIPELVGRLPVAVHLEELDEEQLIRVLTEPKNAIVKQFTKLFKLEQIDLEFNDDALQQIAKQAITKKTGARGLRNVIEEKLIPVQFHLPEYREDGVRKIVVDKEVMEGTSMPKMMREDGQITMPKVAS